MEAGVGLPALFEAVNVSKFFHRGSVAEVRALDNVSLTVASGAFVLLTGPSGSGKTTLLALLGALERPTSGRVLFEGRSLGEQSDVQLARVRRRLGFVFQHHALIPGLPLWENVSYPLIPLGIRRGQRHARAVELLGNLGLGTRVQARPAELSGGEQQRVAIARALVNRPAVLLADEPTSHLDQMTGQVIIDLFAEIHRAGTTVIVASHDSRVEQHATTMAKLEAGRRQNP